MVTLKYDQAIKAQFQVESTSGDERVCKCPFHQDGGKPNLYANARNGLYYCHACGARGHVERIDGAVRAIATLEEIRCRIAEARTPAPVNLTTYPEEWLRRYDHYHPYWRRERGYSRQTIKKFDLGYDLMYNRLTIPIRSVQGKVLGVIQRLTPDDVNIGIRPKYIHPTGFKMGKTLFGANLVAKSKDTKKIALVEGPLDAIACWDAQVPALAMHGARLSDQQAIIIRKLGVDTVVCMTDDDAAGDSAAHSIKQQLTGIQVAVGLYQDGWGKDPGDLTREQRFSMFKQAVPYYKAW